MLTTSCETPSVCQRVSLLCFFSHRIPRTQDSGDRPQLSVVSKSPNLFPSMARKTQLLIFPAATIYIVLLLGNKQQTGLSGNGNSTTHLGERHYEKGRETGRDW